VPASRKKGSPKSKGAAKPVRSTATVAAVATGTARPSAPATRTPRTPPTTTRPTTTGAAPRSIAQTAANVVQRAAAAQKQTRAWAKRKIGTIRQHMSRIVQDTHTIGTLLKELQTRRAHIALGYPSFNAMLTGEGLPHRSTAYRTIRLAEAYTAKQLRALGPTKAFALIQLTQETEAHDVARVLVDNDALIGDKPISLRSAGDIRRVLSDLRAQNTALTHGENASEAEKEARALAQKLRAQLHRRGADEAQVEARVRGGRWGVEAWVPGDQMTAMM